MRIFLKSGVLLLFLFLGASAQDLGSSNKLFGGTKKEPSTATVKKPGSRTASKRKATPAKRPTRSAAKKTTKPSEKAAAKRSDTTTAQPAKKVEITKAAGPKPAIKPIRAETPTVAMNVAAETKFNDLIEEGNSARDSRDYLTAETAYKRARAIKPKDYRAAYGLGNLYSDQQRWEEAENAYRTALQLNPSNGVTYIALSYVLTQPIAAPNLSDRYEDAEKLARKAIELSPRNALGHDQLGVAMELRGLIGQETEAAYRRALQLDDSFAPAYAHLGRLLRRRGAAKEATEAYIRAIERASHVGTLVVVAEVMQSEQRFRESEVLLGRAVNADPQNPAALIMLGRALTALNRFDEAEVVLKRSLSASHNSFTPNSLLATLYIRQKNYEMAEKSLMQALQSVPSYENQRLAQQFEAVGDGYVASGNRMDATRAYRQAARLDPDKESLAGKLTGMK